ncbi:MAG: TraR/DksA C4-type zinc finger protein [Albidovulum sp.]
MKSQTIRAKELTDRQEFLLDRLKEIGSEFDTHQAKDFEEMATEREGDEVLEDLGVAAQHELRMIDAALTRIKAGEYGACAQCGEDISEERLDLLPATPFCAPCAARH